MGYHSLMSKLPSPFRRPGVLLLLIGTLLPVAPGSAIDEPEATDPRPGVVLERVSVEPAVAGPETLCRLRVVLHNRGRVMASLFGFEVLLDGEPIPSYANDLFVLAVPPGERRELALFNFWSSESGRPLPADGTLEVEVRLLEARWYAVDEPPGEGEASPLESWRPLGEVGGLPSVARTVLEIASDAGAEEDESADEPNDETAEEPGAGSPGLKKSSCR